MNRSAKRAGLPHFDDNGHWVQVGPDGKDHLVPSPEASLTGPAERCLLRIHLTRAPEWPACGGRVPG